jgi:hypothetical protein
MGVVSDSSATIRLDRCLEANVCVTHAQYFKYLTTLFQLNRLYSVKRGGNVTTLEGCGHGLYGYQDKNSYCLNNHLKLLWKLKKEKTSVMIVNN